jgi:cytochrome c oxidase subunit 2
LRSHEGFDARVVRTRGGRPVIATLLAAVTAVLASGCTPQVERGWLPADSVGTTNQTKLITDFWNNSWIAALVVGVLVWGLIIWCMVVYRRRKGDDEFPPQIQYNLPMEILYTVVPMIMVAVLFYYTARDEAAIADVSKTPDVTVEVVGKQWSWDFNYLDAGVYETGVHGELDGEPGVQEELPTLYLPVNKRVEFVITARDVDHSFWIPAFLYKIDMIPGRVNRFQVIPLREGTFQGKCAELCGEFHSAMLFNVKVVDQAAFDAHMADLRARGQVGELGGDLNRSPSSDDAAEKAQNEAGGA